MASLGAAPGLLPHPGERERKRRLLVGAGPRGRGAELALSLAWKALPHTQIHPTTLEARGGGLCGKASRRHGHKSPVGPIHKTHTQHKSPNAGSGLGGRARTPVSHSSPPAGSGKLPSRTGRVWRGHTGTTAMQGQQQPAQPPLKVIPASHLPCGPQLLWASPSARAAPRPIPCNPGSGPA